MPEGNVYVLGQKTSRPPPALVKGATEASSLLRVFETPQGTIVAVPVVTAGHAEQLAVDTGFPSSVIGARSIAGSINSGLQGVLGSDALCADGSVIVDFSGAHLWLTKG